MIFELHPPQAAGPLRIGATGHDTVEILKQLGVPQVLCRTPRRRPAWRAPAVRPVHLAHISTLMGAALGGLAEGAELGVALAFASGAAYCAAAATWFSRFGVRVWRQEGRPLSQWLPRFGPSGRAGADRACLMLGIFHAFLCIMPVGGVVTQVALIPRPHGSCARVSVFGAVASAYLADSIVVLTARGFWCRLICGQTESPRPAPVARPGSRS